MAKKEFRYRGKTLLELQAMSTSELADLLPSAARRKLKRGFTETERALHTKLQKKGSARTHCRDMLILPDMAGKTVHIHNGKGYEMLAITDEMIAHRLGEFSHTRKHVKHGSAGVGATKSGGGKKQTT